MFRRCPRNHTARVAPRKRPFSLFKPLIILASLVIMFELLPIDFQHWLAPDLVSYQEVYHAMQSSTEREVTIDDCMAFSAEYDQWSPGAETSL